MVSFVAEYQQNLHTVQVYLRLQDPAQGRPVEFEVLTGDDEDSPLTGSEVFVVRIGPSESPRLSLPVPVAPGLQDVKACGNHFEVKLAVPALAQIPAAPVSDDTSSPYQHLLDSAQISSIQPASFVCASCSLPVIACENVTRYVDLPSEHWTELMDAWMCHAEQKLTDAFMKTAGGGFWPKDGTVLVGGSYLLVDEANVVDRTLQSSGEGMVSALVLWDFVLFLHFASSVPSDTKKAVSGTLHRRSPFLLGRWIAGCLRSWEGWIVPLTKLTVSFRRVFPPTQGGCRSHDSGPEGWVAGNVAVAFG